MGGVRESRLLSAAGWSLTWAVGVAIGVGLGAYLSVQGSAAAPGSAALDLTEVLLLPALAGAAAFALILGARLVVIGIARHRASH